MRTAFQISVREPVRSLVRAKLRTSLAALGIAIGVAGVVCVVALGQAGADRAQQQLDNLGDNLVWVEAGTRSASGVRLGSHSTNTLTLGDADAILRDAPLIRAVSPQVDGALQAVSRDRNWSTHYRGVSRDFLAIRRWEIALGSAFTDDDVARGASVCLLGQTVRAALFDDTDPIGRHIRVGPVPCEVIGVLAAKGQSSAGTDQDDTIIIPYTTAKRLRGGAITWLDDIMCSAVSRDATLPAIDQVTRLLRQRHHERSGVGDDFNIRRPDSVIKAQNEASRTLSILLVSVASIALVVGGVGVMNVMLVAVTERTREIGLRLAIGATASAVRAQFLGEAIMLCLLGAIVGLALGVAGSFAISRFLEWPATIPPHALLIAPLFSIVVGVLSGYYPAMRASRLDPIEALRHE